MDDWRRRRAETGSLKKRPLGASIPKGKPGFHALFSKTAIAYELGTVTDWVVFYFENEGIEDQWTVVTEKTGILKVKRVVRGREAECRDYYQI
jgi:hypothetical protein